MEPGVFVTEDRELVDLSERREDLHELRLAPVLRNLPDEQLDGVIIFLVRL